ncbi:MAG: hypothetical protein ABSG01_14285 [Anaerolineales bacterium]|jgi:hypothetical protein
MEKVDLKLVAAYLMENVPQHSSKHRIDLTDETFARIGACRCYYPQMNRAAIIDLAVNLLLGRLDLQANQGPTPPFVM